MANRDPVIVQQSTWEAEAAKLLEEAAEFWVVVIDYHF
jgi:hypothetical protein